MKPSFKVNPEPSQQNRLPIKVTCVVKELNEVSEEAHSIRSYCVEKGLMVETRTYDSSKYRYDREEVIRLPAFHIEVEGRWKKTVYVIGRPYQIIGDVIETYIERRKQRLAKKGIFRKYVNKCLAWMKQRFHRKTAMERYNERVVPEWNPISYVDMT